MIEDDLSADGGSVAGLVLVELGLFFHQLKDTPGASQPQLYERKGKDRDKRREAQNTHEPHISDQVSNGQTPLGDQPQPVSERAGSGKPQQQNRQVARLDLTLLDIQIAHPAGVLHELAPFLDFLGG